MQTPKEIFLELLKPDGQPKRQLRQYEALAFFLGDPVNGYLRAGRAPGCRAVDRWGVTIDWPKGAPGAIPVHEDGLTVCTDVTNWRESIHIPDIAKYAVDGWDEARAAAHAIAGDDKLCTCFMATGIFEQLHFLMGFEPTLTALIEHPQEMHELIDAITEYRLQFAKMLIDGIGPDVLFTHDDWGTKDSLFMSADMWREFFKEPYRRFYGYIRSRGVIAIHHADSYLAPIVEDMAEIGIQCWQGVLPENNIPELQKRLKGRMILMGGLGASIDRADAAHDEILDYTLKALNEYCPGGHYIPSITYGLSGTVFPHVDPVLNEGIDIYNSGVHMPHFELPAVPRRQVKRAVKADEKQENKAEVSDTLVKLSAALCKGQKKKVLQLTQDALNEGIPAQTVLSDGLVSGMAKLGEDFSANRAFVPEMLMAARCMNAATEILKPLLVGTEKKSAGRVVLGTVKGDMHDIGKNLVRIMMEGNGLEVFDLGSDVTPEAFVAAAVEHDCQIIACSSLLTTTMQEMRRVVTLSKDAGIRDKVKIMVGGAPISQSFCDEIGADAYTEDAASAAKLALELLAR